VQLGFAEAHHKITRRKKGGPRLGELSKFWWFPCNIYPVAEAIDFKFGIQLGIAKAHDTITLIRKVGMALG